MTSAVSLLGWRPGEDATIPPIARGDRGSDRRRRWRVEGVPSRPVESGRCATSEPPSYRRERKYLKWWRGPLWVGRGGSDAGRVAARQPPPVPHLPACGTSRRAALAGSGRREAIPIWHLAPDPLAPPDASPRNRNVESRGKIGLEDPTSQRRGGR